VLIASTGDYRNTHLLLKRSGDGESGNRKDGDRLEEHVDRVERGKGE